MAQRGTYNVRVRATPTGYTACGTLDLGDNIEIRARAKVSAKAIDAVLRRAAEGFSGEFEIGFGFLKKLWRGAKKIAKKVVQSKVLRKVANTVRNPAFMAAVSVIPGIGPAAAAGMAAVGTAYMGVRAMTAKRRGNPAQARKISLQAARMARRYRLPPARFNAAQRYGASLALNPRAISWMARGPRGGIPGMLQTAQRVPAGPLFRVLPGLM
ncbi:MAG: hypothetical protein MPL62_10030 [Alphaproteobacteria bacterium]|nr:hypothetical protein [Alphaproteobacteria bacterium]